MDNCHSMISTVLVKFIHILSSLLVLHKCNILKTWILRHFIEAVFFFMREIFFRCVRI